MCFDDDSSRRSPSSPAQPSRTRISCSRRRTATGSPRSRRCPTSRARTGIVILPDVRGLYRFYEELALRFAERGYAAIAFDYFGRTAGVAKRDDDFEYMPHVQAVKPAEIQADVARVVAWLREHGCERGLHRRLLHGRPPLWLSAAGGHGLAGAVGFYGRTGEGATARPGRSSARRRWRPDPRPAGRRRRRTSRPRTTPRSRQALRAAGVEHELVDVRRRAAQLLRPQAGGVRRRVRDAWPRVLAFVETNA